VRARLDDIDGLDGSYRNRLKNHTPWHNEGSGARSEGEGKCVQRFNAGVIVYIIDLRAARMFVNARLRIKMRVNQDVMIVILMNVLERRQAKCQHQGNARL